MRVISTTTKYRCPYCNTIVELGNQDIHRWNEVYYYTCPICKETPHIRGGNFCCPCDIKGKKAIKIER